MSQQSLSVRQWFEMEALLRAIGLIMNQGNTVGEISAMLGGHDGVAPLELRQGIGTSNRINQRVNDYLNADDEVQARKTANELCGRECPRTGSPQPRMGVPFAEGEP
jgi:hypothetical protein